LGPLARIIPPSRGFFGLDAREHFAGKLIIEKTAMRFQLGLNGVEGLQTGEFYDAHRGGL